MLIFFPFSLLSRPTRRAAAAIASLGAIRRRRLPFSKKHSQHEVEDDEEEEEDYVSLLARCSVLPEARCAHARLISATAALPLRLQNLLVRMYANCGSLIHACAAFSVIQNPNLHSWNIMVRACAQRGCLKDARATFDRTPRRNVVSWNTIIAAYAQNGCPETALGLLPEMEREGLKPDKITFITVLDACAAIRCAERGKSLHKAVTKGGYESDLAVGNCLVHMYGKCGCVVDARRVFEAMCETDVVSWTAMIAAYAQNGCSERAVQLFLQMGREETADPNKITFVTVLDACASLAVIELGKLIHVGVADKGCELDQFVRNSLVTMYGKCGNLRDAVRAFDRTLRPTPAAWNSMISAYARNGCLEESCDAFNRMPQRDAVSWNSMIAAHTQHGYYEAALTLFHQMHTGGEFKPTNITYISVISACVGLASPKQCFAHHAHLVDSGVNEHGDAVLGNCLVNMYGKCGRVQGAEALFEHIAAKSASLWNAMIGVYAQNGRLEDARGAFDGMLWKDRVSWNTMIAAYTQNGDSEKALQLFNEMNLVEGLKPDSITLIGVLNACADMAIAGQGRVAHAISIDCGFKSSAMLGTCLINMYGSCGSEEDARCVFDCMNPTADPRVWNAMIAAYGRNGCGKAALDLFLKMGSKGVSPDKVTFISILSACSHAGLPDDSWRCFDSMVRDYGVQAGMEHYRCMLDMLSRAGKLEKAQDLIASMDSKPDAITWLTMLSACQTYGDLEQGIHAAQRVFELEPQSS